MAELNFRRRTETYAEGHFQRAAHRSRIQGLSMKYRENVARIRRRDACDLGELFALDGLLVEQDAYDPIHGLALGSDDLLRDLENAVGDQDVNFTVDELGARFGIVAILVDFPGRRKIISSCTPIGSRAELLLIPTASPCCGHARGILHVIGSSRGHVPEDLLFSGISPASITAISSQYSSRRRMVRSSVGVLRVYPAARPRR